MGEDFDMAKYTKFKQYYQRAQDKFVSQFTFEGVRYYTWYARHLIMHSEKRLAKELI